MKLPSVRHLIKKYEIHPTKALGQNFLTAVPTLEKIVRLLDPGGDEKVLEIGPGLGLLTRLLAEKARLVAAVEVDPKMVRILERECEDMSNIQVIQGDILGTNLERLCGGTPPWIFAGNIPYNISTPILFHMKESRHIFDRGVLTVQKEVGDRLAAGPGTKDYGILSVMMQAFAKIEKGFRISPKSFYPEPKVDSMSIKITFPNLPPHKIENEAVFSMTVKAAFGNRRKTIKNSMTTSPMFALKTHIIPEALDNAEIDGGLRAETLAVEEFVKLAGEVEKLI